MFLKILLIIITVMILVFLFFLYMIYKYWSNIDFPGGPRFFVKGKENRALYVVYSGRFSGKIILPSKTMHVGYNYTFLPGSEDAQTILGMYWIGIWPFYKIHFRHQQWMEWEATNEGRRIRFRDEMTPYLFVKPFEYAMFLEEAEDINGVPLNVWFTVILVPIEAYKPIFGNDDAYGQVQTLCLGEALLFIKKETFANLGKGKISSINNDQFSEEIQKLNQQIPGRAINENLRSVLGYEILDAKLNSVSVAGELKNDLLKATVLNFTAEEKAKATITEAEGYKKSVKIKAEGDSEARIINAQAEKIAGLLQVDVDKYGMDARKAFYDMLSDEKLEFAQKIELAKKIFADSNLTTYVGGNGILPTLNIDEKGGKK